MSKYGNLLSTLLEAIGETTGYFTWPPEYSEEWRYRQIYGSRKKYLDSAAHALRRGLVKKVTVKGRTFMQLTSKGELRILMAKAGTVPHKHWDGKWRLIIFDIPEEANEKRDMLRRLLKRQGFYQLQASVYIHPHPLNREAITYLKKTGLITYIRILKIEEVDDDSDLRRKFKLPGAR